MDKKSLRICLFLFGLFLFIGYGVCLLVDKLNNQINDNIVDNEFNNPGDSFISDNEGKVDKEDVIESKPVTEVYNEAVHYSGDYVNLVDYVIKFEEDEIYNDKLLTLTVDKIMLNGKEYVFSLKNHPQHCVSDYDYMKKGYNEFYINDKLIYSQYDQSCYLERIYYITVINNKYIGVTFEGQNGNYMYVYDENINLVDTLEYVNIEIKNEKIIFSEYVDDSGCLIYYYTYDVVDGKIIKTFNKKVNNTVCDNLTGEGCDCNKGINNNTSVNVKLNKQNENFVIGNLGLNFVGKKTDELDNDVYYQYILDIFVDDKKIDSNIFGNVNNKVIWSSNYAASFKVLELDDYYILTSFIAKQNDGSYVLIFDKKGNFIKSFEDVSMLIDEDKLEISVTDCKTNNIEEQCTSQKYKISELK